MFLELLCSSSASSLEGGSITKLSVLLTSLECIKEKAHSLQIYGS